MECLRDLNHPERHPEFVAKAVALALEEKPSVASLLSSLFVAMHNAKLISSDQFVRGFSMVRTAALCLYL